MGKNSKGGPKKGQGATAKQSSVVKFPGQKIEGLHQLHPMGASWRQYPRSEARKTLVERLRAKPDAKRSGDEWWQLGEYQVVDGLASGDDKLVNAGSQALMSGAVLDPPHAGCLLDLGWLLCFKGLDQMALFYLDKAVELVPSSRDVWSLRGWACIGIGSREQAVESFRKAIGLNGATEEDRATLASVESGVELETLRKDLILRKFDNEDFKSKRGDPKEAARGGVMQFKQMLERKPEDDALAYALAYCYYILEQFSHAEPLLLRLIGGKPNHADALTILGLISGKRAKPDEQLDYYQRAVTADPNHVLANTNLAAIYQKKGELHRARILLNRVIESAHEDDPNLSIAIDLLGNSFGLIEHDFVQEVELHRRAIALEPRRPFFHANLIVSLLSADRGKDAQRALQAAKDARLMLPNQSLLDGLVKIYQDRNLHPYEYMKLVDKLAAGLGWPALRPLVRRAWDRRQAVPPSEQSDFLSSLGLMASHAGDKNLALDVWRQGMTLPGGDVFSVNLAVELSGLGRHTEALAAAEVMSMNTSRSWTILGNTRMSAGLYKLAIEAYLTALKLDQPFLLPISNAIDTARLGLLAEELDPFIACLESDWQKIPVAVSLLGEALALQGRLTSAAGYFEKALWFEGKLRTPEELWREDREADDLTLLGQPTMGHHYAAARCLLELGRRDRVLAMVSEVRNWPKWMDGDWNIIESEAYLIAGEVDQAFVVVEDMLDQPPPRLVLAKIAIVRADFAEADRLIALGLADDKTEKFNHPFGRPDALFRVLAAQRALDNNEIEQAEELSREAIRRDPACSDARIALVHSLTGRSEATERLELLADGLRRSPGDSKLVTLFIESLISEDRIDEAFSFLDKQRNLLKERGDSVAAYRLGELLALDKLSRINIDSQSDPTAMSWPWIEHFKPPMQNWLRAAKLTLNQPALFADAYAMYLGKVAERLLRELVMGPFRDGMPDARMINSSSHRDASNFLAGDSRISVGAVAKLFEAASKRRQTSDDELICRFREAVASGRFGNATMMRTPAFVNQLIKLGHARNGSTHQGEQDIEKILEDTRSVVYGDKPGSLLTALGVVSDC